jgi:CheY-like chemotaxis protein
MKKILVVDDNKVNREALGLLISIDRPSYQIIEADDGCEALSLAEREHPDLIVLNGTMPILDGHETAEILRQRPQTQGIPVIGLTAAPPNSTVAAGLQKNCDAFLLQPFTIDAFRQVFNELI